MGSNPVEIVEQFQKIDTSPCYQKISDIQQLVIKLFTYYQAYLVHHFYHTDDDAISESINIVKPDEPVSMMINNSKLEPIHEELQVLRDALNQFLKHKTYKEQVRIKSQI